MKSKKKLEKRPTLKKSDILELVKKRLATKDKILFKKNDIEAVITAFEEEVRERLVDHDIRLLNLFKIEVHKAGPRVIRRPVTQKEKKDNVESPLIKVPEKPVVKVKIGKKLKKYIQEKVNIKNLV